MASSSKVVRELLTGPDKWTTHYSARDKNGNPVDCLAPEACRWCVYGAVTRVYGGVGLDKLAVCLRLTYGGCSPATFNDAEGRTYEEVVELLENAGL